MAPKSTRRSHRRSFETLGDLNYVAVLVATAGRLNVDELAPSSESRSGASEGRRMITALTSSRAE